MNLSKEISGNAQNDILLVKKEKLSEKIAELCERFSWLDGNNKPRSAAMLAILSSHICEREIEFLLRNPSSTNRHKRFDHYWTEKSNYATMLLVSKLLTRLTEIGLKVGIATEFPGTFGHYDIAIVPGNPCRVFSKKKELIKIEVKAASGISLEQITRYLLDSTPLVVARFLTNQVVLLRPTELQQYVESVVDIMIQKANRILEGKFIEIQGKYCSECADISCPYNSSAARKSPQSNNVSLLITLRDEEFAWDLQTFLTNLKSVVDRTTNAVLSELQLESSGVE